MMCVSPRVKYLKKNIRSRREQNCRLHSRGGTMAPVARDHNRCNYIWKFLIHPIMFDNGLAFHMNCQCFAAHKPVSASFNFSHDKFMSERIYIRIDWLIAYESRIKNFFNREYLQYLSIESISERV